jgi:hypothetical protein
MTCPELKAAIFAESEPFETVPEELTDHLVACGDCKAWFILAWRKKSAELTRLKLFDRLQRSFIRNDPARS